MNRREILIVDDDADILRLLGLYLEIEGFDVVVAPSGQEALDILKKQKIRLLLTDFNMPEMNGLDLVARVRERHAAITVFLMTGSALPGVIDAAVTAGISHVFAKPLDLQKLVATIRITLYPGQAPRRTRVFTRNRRESGKGNKLVISGKCPYCKGRLSVTVAADYRERYAPVDCPLCKMQFLTKGKVFCREPTMPTITTESRPENSQFRPLSQL